MDIERRPAQFVPYRDALDPSVANQESLRRTIVDDNSACVLSRADNGIDDTRRIEHLPVVENSGAGQSRFVKGGKTPHKFVPRHDKGRGDVLGAVVDAIVAAASKYLQQLKGGEKRKFSA